jgi:hypothetical protein
MCTTAIAVSCSNLVTNVPVTAGQTVTVEVLDPTKVRKDRAVHVSAATRPGWPMTMDTGSSGLRADFFQSSLPTDFRLRYQIARKFADDRTERASMD